MGDQESNKGSRSTWRNWFVRITGDGRSTAPPDPERRDSERRSHSFWSFTYGSFRPRRRIGRRDGDHERIFLDWHEPRVLYLALAIVLMCCADALFTLNLLAVGGEEMNVLMGALIASDVQHFLALKIGVTSACVVLLVVAARRQFMGLIPVFWVLQAFCVGYAMLMLWEIWLFVGYITALPFHWRPWSD